jgi:dsRNA-specific ribonuclease
MIIIEYVLPKKKRKAARSACKKTELEEYFKSKGDNCRITYETKPEVNGHRCTVFCPELGYAEGETKPTKDKAEQSAAKEALKQLMS